MAVTGSELRRLLGKCGDALRGLGMFQSGHVHAARKAHRREVSI